MTNEEIDALLDDITKSVEHSAPPLSKVLWSSSAICAPLSFLPVAGRYFAVFTLALAVGAIMVGSENRPLQQPALAIWREWMRREEHHERGLGFSATVRMRWEIKKIYEDDPRGEIFPLKQAVRLVDTFNRQQQRLETVIAHLETLRQTRELLIEKAARLHELGDKSRDVGATLARVERDLPALQKLSDEINASCYRLDALLVSVRKAIQVKQLHQELDELTAVVTPEQAIETVQSDDLNNIEAQITQEIETFLRLERDTDAHLRQI
jgi:hypothetical protein